MKSFNIDIIFPWEVGLVFVIIGLILIILGVKQSKLNIEDFDKIPLTKPTTKILFGTAFCIFGSVQLLSLLR